jgi:succinate dehydrogenase/fumarate reductase flavoprotein subunit
LQPIEVAPLYAIQFLPLARKNFGGVRTDLGCRVLRPDGTAIEGLFAAGELAGMAGGHINGHAGLEGTMLGPSLFSGRVAAHAMVGNGRLSGYGAASRGAQRSSTRYSPYAGTGRSLVGPTIIDSLSQITCAIDDSPCVRA